MNLSSLNKILITGAKGYIGKFLAKYLSSKGFSVIRFTNDLNKTRELPNCDLIIHCAGKKPRDGIDVEDLVYGNIISSINLKGLSKETPIVFLSTMAVFVSQAYGLTKLLAEQILDKAIVIRLPRVVDNGGDGDTTINLEEVGEKILETINNLSVKN